MKVFYCKAGEGHIVNGHCLGKEVMVREWKTRGYTAAAENLTQGQYHGLS